MRMKALVSAIVAISLSSGGLAFAQRSGDRNDQSQRDGQQDRRDNGQRDGRGNEGHQPDRQEKRGAGPNHNFHKGGRLSNEYRSKQYVVDDWRGHRLSAPPRGYHWVQTGGDYVLVAIATGVIAQLLLGN
jgi:Ni/Co efflux regulator RcnB